jgi:hypothetical protein
MCIHAREDTNMKKHRLRIFLAALSVLFVGAAFAAVPGKEVGINEFGGAIYEGGGRYDLVSGLVQAGGGPNSYDFRHALDAMLGQPQADNEIAKLTNQYGGKNVQDWLQGSNWMMLEGLRQLHSGGTNLPPPDKALSGSSLASGLVDAGISPDDTTFWTAYYYDHLFSHAIAKQMISNLNAKFDEYYTQNLFMVNNQAMYDIAGMVHTHNVRLAKLH